MEPLHTIIFAVLAILWVYFMVQKWRNENIKENSAGINPLYHPDFPRLSIVAFDKESCSEEVYKKYYEEVYEGKTFFWLGNIPDMPGHSLLLDYPSGHIFVAHTENFRAATEDEI